MSHLILIGDSIFDNDRYVPGGPSVIEHLRRILPKGSKATLLAVDGSTVEDVARQLRRVPDDATHLVVSVGGNNALEQSVMIRQDQAASFREVMSQLAAIREDFRREYREMLRALLEHGKHTVVCSVYDSIPGFDPAELAGLALFNEVILHEAFRQGVPLIDLRVICSEATDYARSSPIEPSTVGGGKIARAVLRAVTTDDSTTGGCRVFA